MLLVQINFLFNMVTKVKLIAFMFFLIVNLLLLLLFSLCYVFYSVHFVRIILIFTSNIEDLIAHQINAISYLHLNTNKQTNKQRKRIEKIFFIFIFILLLLLLNDNFLLFRLIN